MILEKLTQFEYNNDLDTYIYPERSWTYKITLDEITDNDLNINISCRGLKLIANNDYICPDNITVKAGSDAAYFNINLFSTNRIFETWFTVEARINDTFATVQSYIIAKNDCPWYTAPLKKGACKTMLGLPYEYRKDFCSQEDAYFRDTGPACKDIYFWDENRCSDFFSGYPALYAEE